jgi:hypothetical protein
MSEDWKDSGPRVWQYGKLQPEGGEFINGLRFETYADSAGGQRGYSFGVTVKDGSTIARVPLTAEEALEAANVLRAMAKAELARRRTERREEKGFKGRT